MTATIQDRKDYDAIQAVNISALLDVKGPTARHLQHRLEHPPEKDEATAAQAFGVACHIAILEPAKLDRAVCRKDWDGRTKAGKDKAQECAERGLIALSPDDYDRMIGMRDSLYGTEWTRKVLQAPGHIELVLEWYFEIEVNGVTVSIPCKGRIDKLVEIGGVPTILDLKTTLCAAPEEFSKTQANLHYHTKGAWYLDGAQMVAPANRAFYWLCIEKEPPYLPAGYQLNEPEYEEGKANYLDRLRMVAVGRQTGKWPAYREGFEPSSIPPWAFKHRVKGEFCEH